MGPKAPFPSKQDVIDFIQSFDGDISRREIAKAFQIKGNDRSRLRSLLKQLEDEGYLNKTKKKYRTSEVPEVLKAQITDVNEDGHLVATPLDEDYKSLQILIDETKQRGRKFSLGVGESILVKLKLLDSPSLFEGSVIRILKKDFSKLIGFVRSARKGFAFLSTDRKVNKLVPIALTKLPLKVGDLVTGQIKKPPGKPPTFVVDGVIGHESDPHVISEISIHEKGLSKHFPLDGVKLAKRAKLPPLGDREDLRDIPLVTIDGEDARDFDDAVFAEKDEIGWHLIVAIADVGYYVRPDDALDKEAFKRGNSTYFPDRVLPMLPEELSNGLCSLKPKEDRACLAAHLWIDEKGELKKYKFVRGLMRSNARLTYTQVQKAKEGKRTQLSKDFIQSTIVPLYGAYKALAKAREKRGTLDFDKDEPKIIFDNNLLPKEIELSERLDSHRLIEEFMITANVAAARTLEETMSPCLYRVHDSPNLEKIEDLRESLKGLGINFAKAQTIQPKTFSQILKKVHGGPYEHLVNQLVLRTQMKAVYSPKNSGHFGLNLPRYAHFTSPIRRYADLVVHRSLITRLKLGEGGLPETLDPEKLETTATHISTTERNSAEAEWDTVERFMALYLSDSVNQHFTGLIDGVNRYGLFIELGDLGVTGLLPMRLLTDDHYIHDPVHHKLKGKYYGNEFRLGDFIDVILIESNPLTGSITFMLPDSKPVNRKKRCRKRSIN